jgi:hypothetical protein
MGRPFPPMPRLLTLLLAVCLPPVLSFLPLPLLSVRQSSSLTQHQTESHSHCHSLSGMFLSVMTTVAGVDLVSLFFGSIAVTGLLS